MLIRLRGYKYVCSILDNFSLHSGSQHYSIMKKRNILATVLAVLLFITLLSVGLWQLLSGGEETNPGIVSPRRTM